jgi:hypothetical protein
LQPFTAVYVNFKEVMRVLRKVKYNKQNE